MPRNVQHRQTVGSHPVAVTEMEVRAVPIGVDVVDAFMRVAPRVDIGVIEAVPSMHVQPVPLHPVKSARQRHFGTVARLPVVGPSVGVRVGVGVTAGGHVVDVPVKQFVVEIVVAGVLVPTQHVGRRAALTS